MRCTNLQFDLDLTLILGELWVHPGLLALEREREGAKRKGKSFFYFILCVLMLTVQRVRFKKNK